MKPRLALLKSGVILLLWLAICMNSSAIASEHGYNMAFVGHVTALDMRNGNVKIATGPTETTGAATFLYVMPRKALQQLHKGMEVYVQADTRRKPWRILHLRPFRRFPKKGQAISEMSDLAKRTDMLGQL